MLVYNIYNADITTKCNIKQTIKVISSQSPFVEWHTRFKTAKTLKKEFKSKNWLCTIIVSPIHGTFKIIPQIKVDRVLYKSDMAHNLNGHVNAVQCTIFNKI